MKKIIVTGGLGFIGSNLIDLLLKKKEAALKKNLKKRKKLSQKNIRKNVSSIR